MVLKKAKTSNIIWMDAVERSTLERFINELEEDWPANTAVTQIVMAVLTDTETRTQILHRLNDSDAAKLSEARRTLKCPWCGFKSRNDVGIKVHVEQCPQRRRPLEAMIAK